MAVKADNALNEALTLDPNRLQDIDIKNVFNQLDVDQNGYLGAPDLLKCFRAMGQDLEDNLVDSMLSQVDRDGDGQISLTEFRDLVKSLEREGGGLRPKGYVARLPVAVSANVQSQRTSSRPQTGDGGASTSGRSSGSSSP